MPTPNVLLWHFIAVRYSVVPYANIPDDICKLQKMHFSISQSPIGTSTFRILQNTNTRRVLLLYIQHTMSN